MAIDSPPAYMDDTILDAEVFRRAIGTLVGVPGVIAAGQLAVTQQGTPNMSVAIAAGDVWVQGGSSARQGLYYAGNGASVTWPIAASDASHPRVDAVIVKVDDAAYAGSDLDCKFDVVMGTPTAGVSVAPTTRTAALADGAGALPPSCVVLAYLLVRASTTSILTADIANVAPFALTAVQYASGPLAGLSASRPGRLLRPTDADQWLLDNGTSLDVVLSLQATVTPPGDYSARIGQHIIAAPASTITLPTPDYGALVIITADPGVSGSLPITVYGAGFPINGPALAGVASFAHGIARSTLWLLGAQTAWYVVVGTPDADIPPPGWVALTLSGGISDVSGAYVPAGRTVDDKVELCGALQSSGDIAGGTAWATLPAGLWPANRVGVNGPVWDTSGLSGGNGAVITTAGDLQTKASVGGTWYLDGIFYRLA